MAAFINFEADGFIQFLNPKPEELQTSACHHIVERFNQFFLSDLGSTMILFFSFSVQTETFLNYQKKNREN